MRLVVGCLVWFEPAVEDLVCPVPDHAAGQDKGGGKRAGEPRHPRNARRDRAGKDRGKEHRQASDDKSDS
jgi:hypothetical protein